MSETDDGFAVASAHVHFGAETPVVFPRLAVFKFQIQKKGREMRIIAMYGTANTGKTSAIRKAYEIFSKTVSVVSFKFRENGDDFEAILRMPNGKTVGFFSQGDCGEDTEHNIEVAEKAGCDVLVTAVRTKGTTLNEVEEYCRQKPEHEVLLVGVIGMWPDSNPASEVYDSVNKSSAISDLTAKHLLNVLEYVLSVI
ncbi:MAG: hypothetical protein MR051_04410 [Lentisphaeria bacterium]|nr:hypothetical protein [Lentisphaeria bacterium]